MGVLGLWQLLQPSSRPLKLQGLEGKKLAIDISIWLYQATKGARNSRNGHITVLYNRICKLLYFKIKPIFVFDGPNVPKLKERVLQNRQRRRNEAANKAKDYDEKLQKNLLETYALKNVLGADADTKIDETRPTTSKNSNKRSDYIDDLFKLPETSEFDKISDEDILIENDPVDDLKSNDYKYAVIGLNDIDKDVFENLPPDIQFEILTNYKDALKAKKSQSFDEFPEKSEDFSMHQMKLLLHKSEISNQINNIKNSMKTSQIINTNFDNIYHQKIASEDHDEVILMTKKNSSSKLFSQKSADSIQLISSENDEQEALLIPDEEEAEKSPEYRIEFTENNKIELVLKQSQVKSIQNQAVQPISQNELFMSQTEAKKCIEDPYIIEDKIEIHEVDTEYNEKNNESEILQVKDNSKSEPEIVLINEIPIEIFKNPEERKDLFPNRNMISSTESNKTASSATEQNEIIIEVPSDSNTEIIPIIEVKPADSGQEIIETDSSDDDDFVEVEVEPAKVSPIKPIVNLKPSIQNAKTSEHTSKPTTSSRSNEEPIDLEAYDDYNDYLLNERNNLLRERNENERLSHSIENYVIDDAKYLLQMFGLPYLNAPGEAEAQCAYLDHTNVTDGTITEDSDVWLFGARRVYKNFFSTDQFIDSYSNQIIKSQLGLDRDTLICVALLVGSDYTEGVENVGIVKAVEILQEFEGQGLEKLKNFKEWHSRAKNNPHLRNISKLRSQLSKLNVPDSFPSEIVYNAYVNPDVDKSNEEFSWSLPSLDLLRKYLASKLGWTNKKVDDDLLPVIRRINETNVQKTIDNFFAYETTSSFSKQSKRMKNAINSFKSKNNDCNQQATNRSNNQAENDLNLSEDEEISTKEGQHPQTQQQQQKRITKSSIKITRLPKSKSKDNKNGNDNKDEDDLILLDSNNSSTSTTKRKSSESQTINKKVARKATSSTK